MSDSFVKCKGEGCLLAFRCRRFTAYIADNSPPFFADAPYKIVDDTLKCILFWGENLNEITDEEIRGNDSGRTEETEQRTGEETKGSR